MKKILLLIGIASCFVSFGQNSLPFLTGARSMALGGSGLAFADVNSILYNQAGVAQLVSPSFSFSAGRRFLLKELNDLAAAGAWPTSSGTFGLSMHNFGFDKYKEQKIGLIYSRKLSSNFSIGAEVDYFNIRIQEYGSKSTFSFQLGLLCSLIKNVKIGIHLQNPVRVSIAEEEVLPTIIRFGGTYTPSEKVTIISEVEKSLDHAIRVKAGVEYYFVPSFALRTGYASNPNNISFGLGYTLKNRIIIDVASVYHQVLGFSPYISVSYSVKKKNK